MPKCKDIIIKFSKKGYKTKEVAEKNKVFFSKKQCSDRNKIRVEKR